MKLMGDVKKETRGTQNPGRDMAYVLVETSFEQAPSTPL